MKAAAIIFLVVAAMFLFSTVLRNVSSQEDQPTTDWWPMFHHDLANTGYSSSASPPTNETLWKFNTGGQVGSPYYNEHVVYVGSYDHNLYAFNASNGALIWKAQTDGIVISRPIVAEGRVFVGSEDYNLYAFNASNGN